MDFSPRKSAKRIVGSHGIIPMPKPSSRESGALILRVVHTSVDRVNLFSGIFFRWLDKGQYFIAAQNV